MSVSRRKKAASSHDLESRLIDQGPDDLQARLTARGEHENSDRLFLLIIHRFLYTAGFSFAYPRQDLRLEGRHHFTICGFIGQGRERRRAHSLTYRGTFP